MSSFKILYNPSVFVFRELKRGSKVFTIGIVKTFKVTNKYYDLLNNNKFDNLD